MTASRILSLALTLTVGIWSLLAIFTYNAPLTTPQADLELHCRYGLCEDRDQAALARYHSFAPDSAQDPATFHKLLLGAPASPELWCDYADALREHQRFPEAAEAFQHALTLAPNSPPILARAATAHLIDGHPLDALPLLRRILEKSPEYPPDPLFSLCRRFEVPPDQIVANLLPTSSPAPAAAYLRFLLRSGLPTEAASAWTWIVRHNFKSPALTGDYASFLLQQKNYHAAFEVWQSANPSQRPNLVADPGFELPPSIPPFGWKFEPPSTPEYEIATDPAERHSGAASLRVHFAGIANLSFRQASQLLVAVPGTYQLSAWVKTAGITTNQGIRLAIEDVLHSSTPLWLLDPPIAGTTAWTHLTAAVPVPAGSPLLRLTILRYPSAKIENKIAGSAWFDDVDIRLCQTPCPTGPTSALQR